MEHQPNLDKYEPIIATYETSITLSIGADSISRRAWKAGSLAWVVARDFDPGCHRLALVASPSAGAISGDYRAIVSHQTLTPFITTGFAVIGALVASRRPRNPIGWIFVTVGLLYALIALAAALIA